MMNKIRKYIALIFAALLFVSCSNLVEAVNEPDKPAQKKVVSSVKGECYVSFNLEEPTTEPSTARTVLPDYNYDNCLFKLFGTRGDEAEVLLLNKVSYNDLVKARNVSVKSGTWTFTVECFDSNDQKILSGTSIPVNITSGASTIQIPMTFITGTAGSIEVSLSFPSGTDIATVASVKAGLYNSPLAAAGDSCVSLDIANNGETSSVVYEASNLESGLTKYVKFFIYSEAGVELGHYTEAVIIGDNLTSRKELSLSTLRSANVLTLTLKTNGSNYTGAEKTSLVLKTFPNEEFSYPMAKQGSKDTYSAKIVNGTKYILYDGDYNTKLIFIPTASESSDGIVEYCDSLTDAANALTNDAVTKSGLGLMVKDNISTSLGDNSDTAGETLFYNAARVRDKDWISLNLEECVAVENMDWYSIERYPMLVSVSFPKNNKGAPDISNSYLAALYINEGVEKYDYSLNPTASLEYLYLPSTLTSINCSGLGNCIKLKNIVISDANEKYSSDGERIMTKDGKTLLSWPSVIGAVELPEGITSIDSGAFCNNTRITDISLPSTLEKIGDQVFSGCSTLRNVNIPEGVTSIGSSAFSGCTNIKEITIPESVTSIGYGAFSSCSHLKSIKLPEGITSIASATFYGCYSLEKIDIPSAVKTLGQKFDINDEFRDFFSNNSVFYNCSSLKTVNLPDGLEEIGIYAFYNCNQLKSINLPAGLKQIDPYAFCNSGLISVTVPDNVEYIGEFAFNSSSQLKTVSIGSGVNCIEKAPFLGCSSITSLTVSSANSFYEAIDNSLYTKGKKEILYYFWNGETEIEIPEGVEKIGDCLFSNNQTITKVDLPSSLTSIGNSAFYYCKQLTEIIIPDNVTVIGTYAFRNCYALESIDLPSGLTTIGSYAFEGTNLKEIRIPGTVTSFGTGAFAWLGLETVYFEEGITYIGSWWIFWGLSKLTTVYLPKSVETIYEKTFEGCNNITDVYYGGSESDWAKISKGSENGTLFTATRHYNADYYKSDDE